MVVSLFFFIYFWVHFDVSLPCGCRATKKSKMVAVTNDAILTFITSTNTCFCDLEVKLVLSVLPDLSSKTLLKAYPHKMYFLWSCMHVLNALSLWSCVQWRVMITTRTVLKHMFDKQNRPYRLSRLDRTDRPIILKSVADSFTLGSYGWMRRTEHRSYKSSANCSNKAGWELEMILKIVKRVVEAKPRFNRLFLTLQRVTIGNNWPVAFESYQWCL